MDPINLWKSGQSLIAGEGFTGIVPGHYLPEMCASNRPDRVALGRIIPAVEHELRLTSAILT
jgi:hypothetical protein